MLADEAWFRSRITSESYRAGDGSVVVSVTSPSALHAGMREPPAPALNIGRSKTKQKVTADVLNLAHLQTESCIILPLAVGLFV